MSARDSPHLETHVSLLRWCRLSLRLQRSSDQSCNVLEIASTWCAYLPHTPPTACAYNVFNVHVITDTQLLAYCTARGLAILATLPDGDVDAILSRTNLVPYTASTVFQPRKTKERIALIRKQGYAHTEDEYFVSDISTAAAITDAQGRGIGAVNIAVARSRWQVDRDEKRFADLVISTASAISSRRRID
jgi:IclR family transcriptional regulator, pca regulon regulatory protein